MNSTCNVTCSSPLKLVFCLSQVAACRAFYTCGKGIVRGFYETKTLRRIEITLHSRFQHYQTLLNFIVYTMAYIACFWSINVVLQDGESACTIPGCRSRDNRLNAH